MAYRLPRLKVRRPGFFGSRIPGTPGKGRASTVPADKTLTVGQIVSGFGRSREYWTALILSGRLRGYKSPGALEYQVRCVDWLAYTLRWGRPRKKDLPPLPRIVKIRGKAFIKGTLVSVRSLERARRLGTAEVDLRDAFPTLPTRTLEAVAGYVRRYPAAVKTLASSQISTPEQDEDDDGVGFGEELDALLESDAELFRRLAR